MSARRRSNISTGCPNLLFVAARYANLGEDGNGPGDVMWVPGGTR